ncbi:hypothetical protein ACROYT_G008006 [Oculina patagonica]
MSQTSAKPGNSANSTPCSSEATKHCSKKLETFVQEMKKQLTQVEDCINILKGNKPPVKLNRWGWTVFQKRLDGSVNFYRGWADYKGGFGNLNGEFWLGLDKIHRLTKTKNRLRVDLEDTAGKTAFAKYDMFAVTSERTKYKLSLGSYSGTAGDSLSRHRGAPFSTKDQDNDTWKSVNCAVDRKGAWWYVNCNDSNLNGLYHFGKHSSYSDGVNWDHWKGEFYSAKRAEMKIRPVHF